MVAGVIFSFKEKKYISKSGGFKTRSSAINTRNSVVPREFVNFFYARGDSDIEWKPALITECYLTVSFYACL